MAWDERQQAMLAEMGLRVWSAPLPAPGEPATALAGHDAGVARREARPASATPATGRAAIAPPAGAPHDAPPDSPSTAAGRLPASVGERPPVVPAVARVASPVDSMDWPTLREAVAGCTACGLCSSRTQTVFGVGHERAEWMIVGEAPGEQEDRQGEPFVGKAGQLLDNMLRAVGLTRASAPPAQQVFIANVLKCRPPMNRNPDPAEVAACEPYLRRQVALVRPRMILAMGRFAVQSLLRTSEPIGRLRGTVHRYEGVPTIVTYHPAYLLRNLPDKARAWDDLCLALQAMNEPTQGRH